MKLKVYIDLVFAVNLLMDYLLLLLMRKLTKRTVPQLRLFLGGVLGGLGACVGFVIYPLRFGIFAVLYAIGLCSIVLIVVFRYKTIQALIKDICLYYAMTFLVGGILNYIYYYTKAGYYITEFTKYLPEEAIGLFYLLLYAAIAGGFTLLVKSLIDKGRKQKEQYFDVVFVFENKSKVCRGFLDTGNQLYDPVSLKPVILVEFMELKEVLPEELLTYCDGFTLDQTKGEAYRNRMKVIPFHAVGTTKGILPAVVFPEIRIIVGEEIKRYENVTVAVYQGVFAADKSYQVILHEKLL